MAIPKEYFDATLDAISILFDCWGFCSEAGEGGDDDDVDNDDCDVDCDDDGCDCDVDCDCDADSGGVFEEEREAFDGAVSGVFEEKEDLGERNAVGEMKEGWKRRKKTKRRKALDAHMFAC